MPAVSIHAPAWGATELKSMLKMVKLFQSTLPHGERRGQPRKGRRVINRFNPRSRMGSDVISNACRWLLLVSIHAPAWGATYVRIILAHSYKGFNPRSRMGSDQLNPHRRRFARCFNPRSRMGSDLTMEQLRRTVKEFQSTLPHGERPFVFLSSKAIRKFQSTLPHGERHKDRGQRPMLKSFNPRSRMGSDWSSWKKCTRISVSIHAPAWGATTSPSIGKW